MIKKEIQQIALFHNFKVEFENGELTKESEKEFKNKVNWINISYFKKLSEEFIKRFQDKVNWDNISYYQKLSFSFIMKFKNKVNWYWIEKRQELTPRLRKEIENRKLIRNVIES